MNQEMSSRERLLTTIDHQEPDHVPLCFRGVAPLEHLWRDGLSRTEALLAMGIDDQVSLRYPWMYHPDVKVRQWRDTESDPKYPLICKELDTPAGTLRFRVRETDDWQPEDLPLKHDYNVPRAVEWLIKGPEDLPKLEYIFYDPRQPDLSQWREQAQATVNFARKHNALLTASLNPGYTNIPIETVGPQEMMIWYADDPGFIHELLAMTHRWIMQHVDLLAEFKPDVAYHSGVYENTAFWSPKTYDELFAPLVQKLSERLHADDIKLHYYMESSAQAIYRKFPDLGIDIWSSLDSMPPGDVSVAEAKREVGDDICLWGGLNVHHTIERGTPAQVREQVTAAIRDGAAGGGYVLSTSGSVYADTPTAAAGVQTLIDTWREFNSYPISLQPEQRPVT